MNVAAEPSITALRVAIGAHYASLVSVAEVLEKKREWGLQYFVLHDSITEAAIISDTSSSPRCNNLYSHIIKNYEWSANFVGSIAFSIDDDASFTAITNKLQQLLSWYTYLGIKTIYVQLSLSTSSIVARALLHHLQSLSFPQTLIVTLPATLFSDSMEEDVDKVNLIDSWQIWQQFHQMVDYNPYVSVSLELTEQSVDHFPDEHLYRWISTTLRTVILSISFFEPNEGGYPVLSRVWQRIIQFFLHFNISILLNCNSSTIDLAPYVQYLRFLQHREDTSLSYIDRYSSAYWDILQSPLQPLGDHLPNQTYEVFEQDPTKYRLYQQAIAKALIHIRQKKEVEIDAPVIVFVVGAGRGPLVTATLHAAKDSQIPVYIFAVEKNPNAMMSLQSRSMSEQWGEQVTLINKDMRKWSPPQLADLLVSELLGSFGDNELSPECLDGAERRLLKPGGLSVPQSYTAFLQPMSSALAWMSARDMPSSASGASAEISGNRNNQSSCSGLETPFVSYLRRCQMLSPQPLPCWSFHHPSMSQEEIFDFEDDPNAHKRNEKYAKLEFECNVEAALLHGFAGYFDCILFDDVILSISPGERHSENMFSWFPIYFPITRPVSVKQGEKITVEMWRCVDEHRVWYEWLISQPEVLAMQNLGGRSSAVRL